MSAFFSTGGQLGTSEVQLYGIDINTRATVIVKVTSESSSTETINISVEIDGVSRLLTPPDMLIGPGESWVSDPQHMKVGDRIMGDASTGSVITYNVTSQEEAT